MTVLILCLPGIGDALMATPMIKLLKRKNPDAQIDVACMFGAVEYVFKNNSNVNDIYQLSLYKENKLKGLKQVLNLRKNKYDISILAFPAFRREYHLVHWLIGAKKRIAHRFQKGFLSELHFLNTDLVRVDENEHNVINNLNLLKTLGIDWQKEINKENIKYDLILDEEDAAFGANYIKTLGWEKENIVGIHPGSINSRAGIYKRWPVERFIHLSKELIKKNKKIIVFCGPEELETGKKIFGDIGYLGSCILISDFNFKQSLGILNSVSLLIANDNGFAHIANALDIPTIVLFGPTNPLWCAPYDKKIVKIIRKTNAIPWFRPDMKVDHPPKNINFDMGNIRLEDVLNII
jgi:heptosyltransferase-2